MQHPPSTQAGQPAPGSFEAAFPTAAERHDKAIRRLWEHFDREQPLAVLAAEGKFETNHVIGRFLSELGRDVACVRLTKPYDDAVDGMREINRALGFEPRELSASDLQNVLKMFLEFQCKHHRRTVIAIEQTEKQANWLLDNVRQLVEAESAEHYGLLIVLAGKPMAFAELFNKAPLAAIRRRVGQRVVLPPFTPAETTEFIRQRVRAAGAADISQLFEFDAISRIHDLSGGIPDEVATLCCKCLQTANLQEAGRIREEDVNSAAAALKATGSLAPTAAFLDDTINEEIRGFRVMKHRLVVRLNEEWIQDLLLEKGSVLIGRGDQCDVVLPGKYISRRHAVITRDGNHHVLRDLGSTNGTFVSAHRVSEYELEPDDVIRIGDFLIEYQAIAGS